jgi:hypothetical protein
MNNYNGFGRNLTVWDNYERGHFLFPVVARSHSDKALALNLTSSNTFVLDNPQETFAEKIARLDVALANGQIETLIVWGAFAELDSSITRHFESEPYFRSGNVRIFRRKN